MHCGHALDYWHLHVADQADFTSSVGIGRHGSKIGYTSDWLGKDRDEIAGAKKRLEDLERDLAAAYARWHALEELAG